MRKPHCPEANNSIDRREVSCEQRPALIWPPSAGPLLRTVRRGRPSRALLLLNTEYPDGSPSARQDYDVDVEISWVAQLGCCLRPSRRSLQPRASRSAKPSWRWAPSSDAGSLEGAQMADSKHRIPAVIQRGDRSPAIRLAA